MKHTHPLATMKKLFKRMHPPRYITKKVYLLSLALLSYWPNVISRAWNIMEVVYGYYSIMFLVFILSLADDVNILIQAIHCLIEVFRDSPE